MRFIVTCSCWRHCCCDPVVDKSSVSETTLDILLSEAMVILLLLLLGDNWGHNGGHHLGILSLNLGQVHQPPLPLLACDQDCVSGLLDITQWRSWECGGGWGGGDVKYFALPWIKTQYFYWSKIKFHLWESVDSAAWQYTKIESKSTTCPRLSIF